METWQERIDTGDIMCGGDGGKSWRKKKGLFNTFLRILST